MMIAHYIFYGLIVMIANYGYRFWESKGWSDREAPGFIALLCSMFLWPATLFFLIVDIFMLLYKRN